MIWDDEINDDYDFKRLRKYLETEYMIQGIGFTGDFGLFEMLEASGASNEELIKMAKREHIDLEKYRK